MPRAFLIKKKGGPPRPGLDLHDAELNNNNNTIATTDRDDDHSSLENKENVEETTPSEADGEGARSSEARRKEERGVNSSSSNSRQEVTQGARKPHVRHETPMAADFRLCPAAKSPGKVYV